MRRVFLFLLLLSTITFVPVYGSVKLTANTSASRLLKAKKVLVKEDVDLGGIRLSLRNNGKLVFKGGSITNGEVILNNTDLSGNVKLFCHVSGKVANTIVYVDWFLPQNDLDLLYAQGFFGLKGYKELRFQQSVYLSGVRGKNNGIHLADVVMDGNDAIICSKNGGSTVNSMLVFTECNNVVIRNFVLKGPNLHSDEEGARHNMYLNKCSNTIIDNVVSHDAFTDGLYIRNCDNVKVRKFEAYRSGRQGCSLTAGTNISFDGCTFDGSFRTAPKSGLDIEPNYPTDSINNVTISNCRFTNNAAAGLTIKLRQGETERHCSISIDSCLFDGNAVSISLRSAPNSGNGEIEIKNCTLKNSQGVSFQSKCYSASGTPVVLFHDSKLENANIAGGGDIREQASFISVHNVSSNPLQGDFGNIHLYNLSIKQDEKYIENLKRVLNLYPDSKWNISNVSVSNISIDINKKEDKYYRAFFIPSDKVINVNVH